MGKNISAIVLAAGKGRRMKSKTPKVLHEVAGKPMLFHVLRPLRELRVGRIIVVYGHGGEEVRKAFQGEGLTFVEQRQQLGTGHAVMCAMKELKGFKGDVLILSGDVPLITRATLKGLKAVYGSGRKKAVLSLITAILDDPAGYGRVLRDGKGAVAATREDRDCTPGEKKIREVNSGTYLVDSSFLRENIGKLRKANRQGEYYLPDLVEIARQKGFKVSALTHLHPEEVMGVNTRVELARAGRVMRHRISTGLMLEGVTVVDPATTYIDWGVKVGADTVLSPSVHLKGETSIGEDCVIEEGVKIKDSRVGAGSVIKSFSVIEESEIGKEVAIGPFARLRPGNRVSHRVRIGNFVEVKKSVIGEGSKANHLSYIGDSEIGSSVNIGAGTITCNYDGFRKYRTTIEDGAFIGSDTQLIAPVKVGKNAYVGSGTTVTRDVPPWSLFTTRAGEKVIRDWVKAKIKKMKKSEE